MKEFLAGSLLAIWIVILGLSTLDTVFAILTIIYPVIIGLIIFNYQLLKQFIKLQIKLQKKKVHYHMLRHVG